MTQPASASHDSVAGSVPLKERTRGLIEENIAYLVSQYRDKCFDGVRGWQDRDDEEILMTRLQSGCRKLKSGWIMAGDMGEMLFRASPDTLAQYVRSTVKNEKVVSCITSVIAPAKTPHGETIESKSMHASNLHNIVKDILIFHFLDEWFSEKCLTFIRKRSFLLRFNTQYILIFESDEDARIFIKHFLNRFQKVCVEIKRDEFHINPFVLSKGRGSSSPCANSFEFMGYRYYWRKSFFHGWRLNRKHLSRGVLFLR